MRSRIGECLRRCSTASAAAAQPVKHNPQRRLEALRAQLAAGSASLPEFIETKPSPAPAGPYEPKPTWLRISTPTGEQKEKFVGVSSTLWQNEQHGFSSLSMQFRATPANCEKTQPCHRLRERKVSQYRRMLGWQAGNRHRYHHVRACGGGDLHARSASLALLRLQDYGRHVHERLSLLQC